MESYKNFFSILICVKDAYHQVKECFDSIITNTHEPYELILINDNSNELTKSLLETYCQQYNNIRTITNTTTQGYTKSLNIGLKEVNTSFVIIVNSDVVVTPNWSKKLLSPMLISEEIAITSPLSNAALWQSIPFIFDEKGNYSINSLPNGYSLDTFSFEVEEQFKGKIANVCIINGFCMGFRRSLLDHVGYFNERDFPMGYGEETDYCIRTCKLGYKILVKMDTYIYHYKSSSFNHKQRNKLTIEGNKILNSLYGSQNINRLYTLMKYHTELNYARNIIRKKYYAN